MIILNGKTLIKKYYKSGDTILLYGGNAEDEPVKIGNNDHWMIAGKLAIVLSDRQ